MRLNIGSGTALRGVRFLLVSSLVMGLHTAHAAAGLDFGYRIDGPSNLRPTLVFNDGEDTYIQPSGSARTYVAGAQQDGAYLRLTGTPSSFTVRVGSITLHVQHAGLPSGPTSQPSYTPPATSYADASFPQHPVAANGDSRIVAAAGGQVADKAVSPGLIRAADKPASRPEVGSNEPPIIGGPINSSVSATSIPAAATSAAVSTSTEKKGATDVSYLAKDFGADGIRNGYGGSIQIHFRARPKADMQFASTDGKHLDASWDDSTNVMTIGAVSKFVVRDGRASVVVSRETADTFDYPIDNAAGLEQVFSESGAIYFRVAEGTKKVVVRADGRVLQGEHKGRYYRVNGAGDSFVVEADGFDVSVTRSHSVRFVDHEGSTS